MFSVTLTAQSQLASLQARVDENADTAVIEPWGVVQLGSTEFSGVEGQVVSPQAVNFDCIGYNVVKSYVYSVFSLTRQLLLYGGGLVPWERSLCQEWHPWQPAYHPIQLERHLGLISLLPFNLLPLEMGKQLATSMFLC